MQDDRDIRAERSKKKLEKAFSFMIRLRLPGGVVTPEQWLKLDDIATNYANGTLRLTTRATFQYHGVIKSNLRRTMQAINDACLDTIAACGDVNRNVICAANPHLSPVHAAAADLARKLSDHLLPKTSAYHEIWLDGEKVKTTGGEAVADTEPLYGKHYLPRKFKTVVAVPPDNDTDIFAHDLGFIAIAEKGKLVGWNVTVGGGMGMTHGETDTFPRTADILGFCTPEQAVDVGEKVMLVQRDWGNRELRKNARLKYTIERFGIAKVPRRGGEAPRLQARRRTRLRVQVARRSARLAPEPRQEMAPWPLGRERPRERCAGPQASHRTPRNRQARRARILAHGQPGPRHRQRLGQSQDKGRSDPRSQRRRHPGVIGAPPQFDGVRRPSDLRLALAESERFLPELITSLEDVLDEAGLRDDDIVIRMTGCPNGCARPYLAEIGFVGRAPGLYNLYLGAATTARD